MKKFLLYADCCVGCADDIESLGEMYWDAYFENSEYWYIGERFAYWYDKGKNIITDVGPQYIVTDISDVEEYSKKLKKATDEILFHIPLPSSILWIYFGRI